MSKLTPAQRRTALESLALPKLRALTTALELHPFDGRAKERSDMWKMTRRGLLLALLISNTACAEFLESFYGTVGYEMYQHDKGKLSKAIAAAPRPSDDYTWKTSNVRPPGHVWNFGLGYRLIPFRVFTDIEFSTISFDASMAYDTWSRDKERIEVDYANWNLGVGYEYQLPKGFYLALDAEYSINSSSTSGYSHSNDFEDAFGSPSNTFGLVFTLGYSYRTPIGPVGVNYQLGTRDPYGMEPIRVGHKINAEIPGIIGSFVIVGAAIAGTAPRGGGGPVVDFDWAWDQFRDEYGNLTWRCRGMHTGRFAEDWRCAYKVMVDATWPGY